MRKTGCGCAVVIVISALLVGAEREASSDLAKSGFALYGPTRAHEERPRDPWMPRPSIAPAGAIERCEPWVRGPFVSVQVNVDENGCNILGDAANEPSIAIDPTDANKIVIGWRQFDSVESDF